jgi:hypothetical protein
VRGLQRGGDEFFLVASDGLWDVLAPAAAVSLVRRLLLEGGGDVAAAARGACDKAIELGGVDNVTVLIVVL